MRSSELSDQARMSPLPTPDPASSPQEVFRSCKSGQARMQEIEQKTLVLIENTLIGDAPALAETITQLKPMIPMKKSELEIMAQVIVSRALSEVQHCKACVCLSDTLHMLLPANPSAHRKKAESFIHALLDVFQTEFEMLFETTVQRNENRLRAIVQFAGHLYCHRLLGYGVVSQIVQDLIDHGERTFANELLWLIGMVTPTKSDCGTLGTVPECDSDGAFSDSTRSPRRRPSYS